MAFPTTGVLDSFNSGASQALSARAGWSASDHIIGGFGDLTTDSVPTKATGTTAGNAWGTSFSNPEVWVVMSAWPTTNDFILHAYWDTALGNGYAVQLYNVNATDWSINLYRVVSGGYTNLGNHQISGLVAGDALGHSAISGTVSSYYRKAGVWTTDTTVSDSTYSSGVIGLRCGDSATGFDSFNGGATVTTGGHNLGLLGVGA